MYVICFISQWIKRSRHSLFVFPPKKTLIWRRHCSIGQSCCSMTSKLSIHWFSPERSLNLPKDIRVCIRSINQSNHSIPVRCCLCFVCTFSIQSHTKIALLETFQNRNSHDLYVLMYPGVQIRPCPHESERCKITQFCTQNKSGSENSVSCMS